MVAAATAAEGWAAAATEATTTEAAGTATAAAGARSGASASAAATGAVATAATAAAAAAAAAASRRRGVGVGDGGGGLAARVLSKRPTPRSSRGVPQCRGARHEESNLEPRKLGAAGADHHREISGVLQESCPLPSAVEVS